MCEMNSPLNHRIGWIQKNIIAGHAGKREELTTEYTEDTEKERGFIMEEKRGTSHGGHRGHRGKMRID
jgi:hypothetical protein